MGRLLTTLVVLALTLLVVCAIGLGYSALTARTSSSAVLTYLTVSFLGLGLPLLFLLLLPTVTTVDTVVQRTVTPDGLHCVSQTVRITQIHTSRIWWLLAPSPYVVVADASPKPAGDSAGDPLSLIRAGARAGGPAAAAGAGLLPHRPGAARPSRRRPPGAARLTGPDMAVRAGGRPRRGAGLLGDGGTPAAGSGATPAEGYAHRLRTSSARWARHRCACRCRPGVRAYSTCSASNSASATVSGSASNRRWPMSD